MNERAEEAQAGTSKAQHVQPTRSIEFRPAILLRHSQEIGSIDGIFYGAELHTPWIRYVKERDLVGPVQREILRAAMRSGDELGEGGMESDLP